MTPVLFLLLVGVQGETVQEKVSAQQIIGLQREDLLEAPAEEGELAYNNTKHEFRVSEFYSAYVNISYTDSDREVVHSERKEVGRFSSGGARFVAGVAFKLQSQSENASLAEYACTKPLKFEPMQVPTIAIIKRGMCTFNKKVENAVAAGASGVLIYNDAKKKKLKTIQVRKGSLPTVFTYRWKGLEIVKELDNGNKVFIALQPGTHCKIKGDTNDLYCRKANAWSPVEHIFNSEDPLGKPTGPAQIDRRASVLFVSVSFLVLIMISLVWLLLYYVQRFRFIHNKDELERRMGRQAKQALSCVTLLVVEENDSEAECTVCIDTLKPGQEARSLPCKHTFHRSCIDSWLLSKRKCPLCNLNIVKHFGLQGLYDIEDSLYSDDVDEPTNTAV